MTVKHKQHKNLEVTVYDGKYTVIQYKDGSMEILRYREPWPANSGPVIQNGNVILALASRVEALEAQLKAAQEENNLMWHQLNPEGMGR